MRYALLPVLFCAATALAGFGPNVRIDHEDIPDHGCGFAAITLGPGTGSNQPLLVAFEDDTGIVQPIRADVMFQKSTDAGRTWLPKDVLVRRGSPFAMNPDITTDPDGNIYIVYNENGTALRGFYCVRSSDGGATWFPPTRVDDHDASSLIGSARIAADSAGNLICAWNDDRTGSLHIWSSVSTDRGATWSQNVRVDDDTTNDDCYQADVFVQPGTNHYLVAAEAPCPDGHLGCYLYRSTDMGQTFQPGVRLDTFGGVAGSPHVVADAQHVICDFTGNSHNSEQINTEARTLYTQPDTWGSLSLVSKLDTSQFWSYYNGAKLAISADGCLHTALMVCHDISEGLYLTYYVRSSDHGVTWSRLELVNDDTTTDSWNPDIAADSAGHAYVVWQVVSGQVWFSTNCPAAIAEQPSRQTVGVQPLATIVRNVLRVAERPSSSASPLLDISGREVMDLKPGANDVSRVSPGIYFVREARTQAVRKVVITR
ncbi:MAG TPA: exo-alpha-sialidase [bacterium]|nr:exo-alpha-sialidase [bacterium]